MSFKPKPTIIWRHEARSATNPHVNSTTQTFNPKLADGWLKDAGNPAPSWAPDRVVTVYRGEILWDEIAKTP